MRWMDAAFDPIATRLLGTVSVNVFNSLWKKNLNKCMKPLSRSGFDLQTPTSRANSGGVSASGKHGGSRTDLGTPGGGPGIGDWKERSAPP